MITITVRKKNQVTIPRELRAELGVRPGDFLCGRPEGDRLILTPAAKLEALDGHKVQLRDRHQFTLPKELCQLLWVSGSHQLRAWVEDGQLILMPGEIVGPPSRQTTEQLERDVGNARCRAKVQAPLLEAYLVRRKRG